MNNLISKNLRYLRDKHEMTQEQFAEKLGVSRQTVAKWENGDSLPDIEKCTEIAMMFKVSLDALAIFSLDEQNASKGNESSEKYVFGIVKVGERGQVVIPKRAREVYNIKPGDRLLSVGDEKGMAFAKFKDLLDLHFV